MDQSAIIDQLRPHLRGVRVPGAFDAVYKDECQFSFDTRESPGGLYVNLNTHQAFGRDFVALDQQRTGNRLYLHTKWTRVKQEAEPMKDEEPVRMGLGVEGGFQLDEQRFTMHKEDAVVLMPENLSVGFPCADLPELIIQSVQAILNHTDATDQERISGWEAEVKESRYYADLVQENNGKKIPSDPKQWRCEEGGQTENLWLNLSDGHIGSGRQNWDGTGGTGAALRHYEEMKAQGKHYPLVVKLGTITQHGADVFSYSPDENDMVKDPKLAEHLRHWGINVMEMKKTEKTMAELEISLNKNWEFDRITEAGKKLQPVHGPGLVGLRNLGNSCYINTVLQCLFAIPEMAQRYLREDNSFFLSAPQVPADDAVTQLAKLAQGLLTDRYAHLREDDVLAVQPTMLRLIFGRNHPEFSTGAQQDAGEYFLHFMETLRRMESQASARLGDGASPDSLFRFGLEERYQCQASNKVRYQQDEGLLLSLPIPMDRATNVEAVAEYEGRKQKRLKMDENAKEEEKEEAVKPTVPLTACFEALAQPDVLDDFFSSATGARGRAHKTTRIRQFPPYIMLQLRRYYVGEDWTPKKLDVVVDVPDVIDLEPLRARGKQEGEELLPNDPPAAAAQPPPQQVQPDEALVVQLVSMGFSENGCKRAAVATNNGSVEAAMEWVFAHMEDADFNDPLPAAGSAAGSAAAAATPQVKDEDVQTLAAMGFTPKQATKALKETGNHMERAVEWLFSHPEDDGSESAPQQQEGEGKPSEAAAIDQGSARYELLGFISHIGTTTTGGHYVCHIRKNGQWVMFDDRKVAASESVPKELGYLYLYRRLP